MHAMTYDPKQKATVLVTSDEFSQIDGGTWHWDGEAWSHVDTEDAFFMYNTLLVYDDANEILRAFSSARGYGGYPSERSGTWWEWTGSGWSFRNIEGPQYRRGEVACFDSNRGVTVMFGGGNLGGSHNNTWELGTCPDADDDGVPDAYDECRDTPRNVVANLRTGCRFELSKPGVDPRD
jgi:hypothetical protein